MGWKIGEVLFIRIPRCIDAEGKRQQSCEGSLQLHLRQFIVVERVQSSMVACSWVLYNESWENP